MSARDELHRRRAEANIRKYFRVLNKLEPHLGCVICRGSLTDGACPRCEQEAQR